MKRKLRIDQGCTTHGSGPRRSFIRPSEQVKKYKKLMNDGDFMNKLTANNFAIYYNPKQL